MEEKTQSETVPTLDQALLAVEGTRKVLDHPVFDDRIAHAVAAQGDAILALARVLGMRRPDGSKDPREATANLNRHCDGIRSLILGLPASREILLALTKLDELELWLARAGY